MSEQKCEICSDGLVFRWSDTHGVGVCCKCGAPYTLLHYENNERVERPPTLALNEQGKELARRYWQEKHARVFPACYSFISHGGTSYCGATEADCRAFERWYRQQPESRQASANEVQA